MYRKGELVVHPGEGVCKVEDIRAERFPGGEEKQYYILRPVYGSVSTTVFLPVSNDRLHLRPLLSADDIASLLTKIRQEPLTWLENDKERQVHLTQILHENEPECLLRLVLSVQEERMRRSSLGRKLRFFDDKALQDAEKLITQEFACVLNIATDEVLPYIREQIRGESVGV